MITAWRIVRRRFAPVAFTGDGARLYGGRWNSPGQPVVYTAATASLAVLEMLVHLDRSAALASYLLIPCEFDEALVTAVDIGQLPSGWRNSPAPSALAVIGDAWRARGATPVLAVPSALIEHERNYLLNPAHADFSRIAIGSAQPFSLDSRLAR